ncbi:glycerol/H+ symporter [Niveomyces insectorum RCEF 264]|uniref:Glycerol/H+ symporter n=1 Tax=Niveomyces insectorum RCEF 264 TaxID=1081102 RepID=A0A162IA94_9HYPO|nr:glycerol/H+ symporter [Niveomyces insectorum RCEF 264]
MSLFSFLRSIYDVDTLDTRFTTPSTVPYEAHRDGGLSRRPEAAAVAEGSFTGTRSKSRSPAGQSAVGRPSAADISKRAEPSKWRTPEFFFYYAIFIVTVPYMFWVAYDVSRPSDPRYADFADKLAPGWIPGRKIDTSDAQYHTFRSNLPYMALLLAFHPLLRKAWNTLHPITGPQPPTSSSSPTPSPTPEQAEARLEQRLSFDYLFAFVFLIALHGVSAAKVLLILAVNYQIATALPRRYVPVATWVFNIGTLFANELAGGYKLANVASLFSTGNWAVQPLAEGGTSTNAGYLVRWAAWTDGFGGLMPRWEILFNLTVLRLISFNLDHYWSHDRRSSSPIEKKQLDPAHLSERDRVVIPAPSRDFSFRNYIAYTVYAPLYLTGPIVTFNDFVSQARYQPATIEPRRTRRYAVRFVLALLAMELVLHYDYVGAIAQSRPQWATYTPAQLALLSFFNLHLIWLKLLLPWRLFRLWALLDGVDPPENMLRCVSNNYSTLSFWRGWHRSYNRWLVRYLWVPLGGANFATARGAARSLLTYLLVFTFVALWHDIQLRLLVWGWLVVLFFVPEVLASYLFPRRGVWARHPTAYRMLCCGGAVINILLMMTANLVGFAVGLDGLQSIVHGILHDWAGVVFLVTACGALFVGVQVMFEIRQAELRRGISLKC